jgi:hypothetical protein
MERTGRTRVDVYRIEEKSRPGRTDIDRGTASFYRPEINNSREVRSHAEPSPYTRDNGSGRMEEVESRGRQHEFVRERNEDRNVQINVMPCVRVTVPIMQRSGRESNSNRPNTRDEWQGIPSTQSLGGLKSEAGHVTSATLNLIANIRREQFGFETEVACPGSVQTDQHLRESPLNSRSGCNSRAN